MADCIWHGQTLPGTCPACDLAHELGVEYNEVMSEEPTRTIDQHMERLDNYANNLARSYYPKFRGHPAE